ncbi:MAG: anaerobic ribonucleoside-triphosphate reductase, partial [Candidatus Aenigmarchaeota archaeon]|nr:anaerobic ribonucleoside-triphosphate reductase [Candidatus Aenigmarchaeota archaeon]
MAVKNKKNDVDSEDRTLFVRTSDDDIRSWDKMFIVRSLVNEVNMPEADALKVATEVEGFIKYSSLKFVSAPLVREITNTKLLEHGYEEYRKKYTRLGLPLNDMTG